MTLSFSVVTGIDVFAAAVVVVAAVGFFRNLFGCRGVLDEVVAVEFDFLSLTLNCNELSSSNGLFVDDR